MKVKAQPPIFRLVRELQKIGRNDLADRAINGEWDGSREEAEAWFKREMDKC